MALSAAPTRTEVIAELHANACYAINNSATEAKLYLLAIHYALLFPKSAAKGQEEFEFDTAVLNRLYNDCANWLGTQVGVTDLQFATRTGR